MDRIEILSKETLLCYLINELSDGNYQIITHLDEDGCWLGSIDIRPTDKQDWLDNTDEQYYITLADNLKKVEKLHKTLDK